MMHGLNNRFGFGLVTGALLLGSACSSGSSGGTSSGKTFDAGTDPNRNAVTVGHICDRLAQIQCAGEAYCCTNPGRTQDECYTAQKAACDSVVAGVSLDAVAGDPVAGFDAAKAEAAFTEFETLASKCDPTIASFGAQRTGLLGIVAGTVPTGGTCTPSALSDLVKIGAALVSCDDSAQACMPDSARAVWTCTALADANGACFTDLNCKEGLYCDAPPPTGGKCAARKAAGASCQLSNECASFSCTVATHTCAEPGVQTAYCLKQ